PIKMAMNPNLRKRPAKPALGNSEAKSIYKTAADAVQQARNYAEMLGLKYRLPSRQALRARGVSIERARNHQPWANHRRAVLRGATPQGGWLGRQQARR